MAFTIYTVSDPATISSVMTSMAMFFGQDSWVGTMIKTGLIISMLLILGKGVLASGGFRLDILLVQLLVVWVAFLPKTTVTIEQFDNAAPARVVDDIPLAIAVPGALAGSFALFMTQKIETVMQGIQPNYMHVSGEVGMFTPAKTLMRIVNCANDPGRCMDENFMQTLYAASRYCGGAEMSNQDFHTSKNVFHSFSQGLTENNQTVIYTKDKPYSPGGMSGEAVNCSEAKIYIEQVGTDLEANNPSTFEKTLESIAKNTEQKKFTQYAGGAQPATNEWTDTLGLINRVTSSGAEMNTLAIANVMSFAIADQMAKSSKTNIDKIVEIKRDTGLFEWAKSEADNSMMVTTTAPKFMDILFFIFIATTPVVMFIVMANPEGGIKVVGGYMLFGLWTQSWIPMMAIITAWYQNDIMNYPQPGTLGFSAEYMAGWMRHVYTSTIVASNMLQSAPYMMFAIMSGSMFALSNMISKAAPSGAGSVAEGGGAMGSASKPGAGGPSAAAMGGGPSNAAQLSSVMGGQAALSGPLGSGGFAGGANVKPAMGGALPQVGVSSGLQLQNAAADAKAAEATQAATEASERAWQKVQGLLTTGTTGISSKSLASAMRSSGYTVADTASDTNADTQGQATQFTRGQNTDQTSRAGLYGKAGVNLGGLFGLLGGAASKLMGSATSAAQKGALQAVKDLSQKGTEAFAKGDIAGAGALFEQAQRAGQNHDEKYGAGGGVLGAVGDVLSKAIKLEGGVQGTIDRSNKQGTGLTHTEGGGNQQTVAQGRTVTNQKGATQQSGTQAERSNALTQAGTDLQQAVQSAKTAFQNVASAREAQTQTRTATASSGIDSSAKLDTAEVVAAWGNKQHSNNGGRWSGTPQAAMNKVVGALANVLGSEAGNFANGMSRNYQRLLDEGKGQTMSSDQLAAAAAVQTLHGMMGSSDKSVAASGFAGIAALASESNMGGAINATAIAEANALMNTVGHKIEANKQELAPGSAATANLAGTVQDESEVIASQAHERINQTGAAAVQGFNAASNADYSAEGNNFANAVKARAAEVQAANNPAAYGQKYDNAVANTTWAPTSDEAVQYTSGERVPTLLRAAGDMVGGAIGFGSGVSGDVVAAIPGGPPASSGPVTTGGGEPPIFFSNGGGGIQGGVNFGGGVASEVANGIPGIPSGGGGSSVSGGSGQQPISKPNSSAPSNGSGKGPAPIQGR